MQDRNAKTEHVSRGIHRIFGIAILILCHAPFVVRADDPTTSQHGNAGESVADMPFGITDRVPWTTSRIVGTPDPPPPYHIQRSFPYLKFSEPVYLIAEPGSQRLFVVEVSGKIIALRDDEDARDPIVLHDMERRTFSMVFHPDYQNNGFVYVFTNGPKNDRHNRITRFEMSSSMPRKWQPETETIIIEWASAGHDGGDMVFGSDGYLYITAGDGTSDSDTNNTGQDITDLPGGLLRIDVDHPDDGQEYGIPQDNPFLDLQGARPELWAFGFRNPWRISFDEPTGNIWIGDVGQDLWELIILVKRGGNYGWSVMEGSHPFYLNRQLGPADLLPPIAEHHHTEARCITGGYVYRGKRLKELAGAYIYCDYNTGTVWGLWCQDGEVTRQQVLANSNYNVATFGRNHAEELFLVAHTGEILRLEPNDTAAQTESQFPRNLSETGLFESLQDHQPAAGLIPYTVAAPYWSDGATKERFIALPGEDKIDMASSRGWGFEDGAVLVQTLSLAMEVGQPQSSRRIETRILTRHRGEWAGYTYRWNEEQTDAALVDASGADTRFSIKDPSAPNGARNQSWHYPSRSECMGCHARAVKYVLGLTTLQMNTEFDYGEVTDNQLRTLGHIGLFKSEVKDHDEYSRLVNPHNQSADINDRARSYLHANCSHCHVTAGGGNAQIELEFTTELKSMKVFGIAPLHGDYGIANAKIVGQSPSQSIMLYRMSKLGGGRMPRLGSDVVDETAVALMHDWIFQLPDSDTDDSEQELVDSSAALEEISNLDPPSAQLETGVDQLLSSTSGAIVLAQAVSAKSLSDKTRQLVIAKAVAHASGHVRDLFERFIPEEQRVKRLGNVIDPEQILGLKGDIARGKELFFDTTGVQCKSCHRIDGVGKQLGPDLNEIGKKYDRAQLLESLLQPSKKIDPKYITFVIETESGQVHSGLIVERTPEEIVLKDNEHKILRIPTSEVEVLLPQRKSLMPEMLLRDLTAEQAANLLEYLASLK